MAHTRSWKEAGQPFVREGLCIRTLKPGQLKLAYGDDRLRDRPATEPPAPRGKLRRALTFLRPARAAQADLS